MPRPIMAPSAPASATFCLASLRDLISPFPMINVVLFISSLMVTTVFSTSSPYLGDERPFFFCILQPLINKPLSFREHPFDVGKFSKKHRRFPASSNHSPEYGICHIFHRCQDKDRFF